MARSGKRLLCKPGALSRDPHHPQRKTGVGHVSVTSVLGGGHRNTGVEHVPVMSEVGRQEQKNRCGAHACNASAGEVETN